MPHVPATTALALAMSIAGCNDLSLRSQGPDNRPLELAARTQEARVGTAPKAPHNPKELGWVRWHRDYDEALAIANKTGKPLFLLFQEVPGCSTCVGFGESVLSHPLVIEAIETEFVPVAIHNNKGGKDRVVLNRFDEPSWNNPVVRFVNKSGRDLIGRADGVWSTHGIADRMVRALKAAGRDVPAYLTWAVEETAPFERATFSMHCYWTGEACLGDIPGVISTRAGWLNGHEVVEVDFDESKLTKAALRKHAANRSCGDFVAHAKDARDASNTDQKFHLKRSRWRYLPLTPLQASRVNSALGRNTSPKPWVSPRQLALYRRIAVANDTKLAGLERPNAVRELASYERALRIQLAQQ